MVGKKSVVCFQLRAKMSVTAILCAVEFMSQKHGATIDGSRIKIMIDGTGKFISFKGQKYKYEYHPFCRYHHEFDSWVRVYFATGIWTHTGLCCFIIHFGLVLANLLIFLMAGLTVP